jgi:AbrB family looped-hinge helix DNA binding protein
MEVKMTRSSTISSKGQITVPLEIRNRLGLKKGDRVEFVVDDNRTTIRPARAPENPFVKYVGALPAFSSTSEINAWVRTLRDEEGAGER